MILELAHNISVIWPNQLQNRTQRNAHVGLHQKDLPCYKPMELGGGQRNTFHPALMFCSAPIVQIALYLQEVSHSDTDQAQPCLASVGNRSWAAGWYGCDHTVSHYLVATQLGHLEGNWFHTSIKNHPGSSWLKVIAKNYLEKLARRKICLQL